MVSSPVETSRNLWAWGGSFFRLIRHELPEAVILEFYE